MPMARRGFHWLLGALLLVSFVAVLPEHQERVSKPEFKPDYVPGHDRLNGQWQMRFASDGETPLVHAPAHGGAAGRPPACVLVRRQT